MGTGVLSLPHALSVLGVAFGTCASLLFGCAAVYIGVLLSRTRHLFYPEASSYDDLALATGGRGFRAFTAGVEHIPPCIEVGRTLKQATSMAPRQVRCSSNGSGCCRTT